MQTFSIGSVLGRSFAIWGANFLAFFVISAIVHLPELVFNYAALQGHIDVEARTVGSVTLLLSTIFGLVGTGALAYGVFAQLRGEHASIGRCIAVGLSRLPTLLWLAVLLFLIFMGIGLVVVIGGGIVGSLFGIIHPIVGAIVMLTIVLGPLLAMYCRLYVASPAAVVEQAGAVEALRRSGHLTEGSRKSIFGIIFVMGLILVAGMFVLGFVTSSLPALAIWLVQSIFSIAWGSLSSTACAVTYHDLREIKEGVGVDQLSAVFE